MFYSLGRVVAARARLVLALAIVALIAFAILGIGVFGRLLSNGFDDPSSGSTQASHLLDQNFGGEPNMIFLVRAKDGPIGAGTAARDGAALASRLAGDSRLEGVTSYWQTHAPGLVSRDGTDALILVTIRGDDEQASKTSSSVLTAYKHVDTSAISVRIGGQLGTDIGSQVGKDIGIAESIAVPITLLLLVVVFGNVVAALLPLGISLIAIFGALAELDVLTHVTSVSIFAINLVTALGLGLGIDYALLMVSRFREELAGGADVAEAVARTTATAGRTIAFSSLTVAAALAAMLVFPVYFLKSFAYGGVGVTLFAAAAALLVMPALLTVLGERTNAGHVPGLPRARSADAPFWGRLATVVMRRPVLTAIPVLAVLVFFAVPLFHVTFSTPDERALPTSAPSHQVGDALRSDFATQPNAVDVVLRGQPSTTALGGYAQALSRLSGAQSVSTSLGTVTAAGTSPGAPDPSLAAGDLQRLTLRTGLVSSSAGAQQLVRAVRAVPPPAGTTAVVGGSTAQLIDDKHAIGSHLLLAALIIVATSLILLFLFTGSVVQPVRALLGNALTLAATLGVMVFVFQDGHFASILGFTPTPTNTDMPVLLFCVAFGLSMDYEVFVVSRIKELHDAGSPTAESVSSGLARSGRIVSTAAALLSVSFFAFGTSKVSFIQFFGLGSGLAILIDATIVRGVLVPASMRLLGDRSWWAPGLLRRTHERLGLSEQAPAH